MRAGAALLCACVVVAAAAAARAEGGPLELKVVVADAAPILGLDHETDLAITAEGAGPGTLPPPTVRTSAGRIEDVTRTGPRSFSARYIFPTEVYPQAAILVAECPAPLARGFTVVRLRAPTSLTFATDPGASVTVRVGTREFGPQIADREGHVRLTVVVPPGIPTALARSVNEFGKATEIARDLAPPLFPRVLLIAPDAVAAGDQAEVAVFAVDPSGLAAEPGAIALHSSHQRPQPLGGGPGTSRFLVRAPGALGAKLVLTAVLRGQPETEVERHLRLVPGRAVELDLHPDRAHLPIGTGIAVRVLVNARDAFGNPAGAAGVQLYVDGAPAEPRTLADGRVAAVVPAPARYAGRDHVEVEAVLDHRYAREDVPLSNVPAALVPVPDPARVLTPRLGVLWNLRQPPGAAFTAEALFRSRWRALELGASLGYLHNVATAVDGSGLSSVTIDQLPLLALGRWRFRPRRRLELGATVGVGAVLGRARVRSLGWAVSGVGAGPAAQGGGEVGFHLGGGFLVAGARFLWARLGALTSGDTLMGNSAGPVVDVGYRLGF